VVENTAEVQILDARAERMEVKNIIDFAAKFRPEIVGISNVVSPSTQVALSIARGIRATLPNAKIILGGHHATFTAEELLKSGYADIIVRGEGEETFKEVVIGKKMTNIKGISFVDKRGTIIHNPPRSPIENLNNLPFPARHKLKREKYHAFGIPGDAIETSRGCPFQCTFCSGPEFHGKKWRARSPESIMGEIMRLVNLHKSENIFFIDDNFTGDMKRVDRLCEMIINSGVRVNLFCQARVDSIVRHPKVVTNMKKAGFWLVFLGIESPSQQFLDRINKNIKIDQVKKAVKILKFNDIVIWGAFIVGFPGQPEEMIKRTVDFAKELDVEIAQFTLLTPLVGSQLYKESEEKGTLLTKDWTKYDLTEPVLSTNIAPQQLKKLFSNCYKKFYLRPTYIFKILLSKQKLLRLGLIKSWRYWIQLALLGNV
jgi:radical SAM superfamily enzyme YgiQ (UPF0313 family)